MFCKLHRTIIAIAIPFWVMLLLNACNNADSNSDKSVFRLNLSSGNLESIDPAYAKDLYMMWVDHMVYNTLVETNENLQLVPSLAKRWEISADGLTYTFHLRNDVFFHDAPEFANGEGRKMTAHDVAYSFSRITDPAVASYGAWIFNGRVATNGAFTAKDDTTFVMKLTAPFRPMVEILSMPYCSVVPREVIERWGKEYRSHPCGTGPFAFKYWDEGNILVLHRNANYWETDSVGNKLPYLDAVELGFVDSKATEFFLFLQGKIDFVNGADGKDYVLTKRGMLKKEFEGRFKLEKQTYLNTEYLGFLTDTSKPVMKSAATGNVLVRQAINYAIDRQKIVTYFRYGIGSPATSGFIPAGMPGYDSTHSYGYSYQPAKSLELLAKAGYPNGKGLPPVNILVPDNWSDIINFIATQLQEVGIQTKVEIIQPNILKQQMSKSEAVVFRAQWLADYPDAETYLAVFNSKLPAPPNYTRFNNAQYDAWYDESMRAPDSIRWQLYRKMDSLAVSLAPVVPMFYDQQVHFTQNKVQGLTSNPMNLIDLKRVSFKKAN